MMEIEIGVRRLELYDRRQAAVIRAWKEGPLETGFRGRFVNVDLEIAERCAARSRSAAGNRRPDRGDRYRQTAHAGDAQRARLRGDAGRGRQSLVGAGRLTDRIHRA